jgi:hypothetical protein
MRGGTACARQLQAINMRASFRCWLAPGHIPGLTPRPQCVDLWDVTTNSRLSLSLSLSLSNTHTHVKRYLILRFGESWGSPKEACVQQPSISQWVALRFTSPSLR